MPQMSPIQWTVFFNLFLVILLISSITASFLIIYNYKSLSFSNKIMKKMNFKW